MTSQGSAYARLRRALERGNALVAWAAAAELERVPLGDALALCLLLARTDAARYEKAAVRWHARLCREVAGLSIDEAALSLFALRALPGPAGAAAGQALRLICERHGMRDAARRMEEWLERNCDRRG
jgi:hypothetical protein